jgi:cytochrome c biogenesis protein ResB
LNGYLNNGQVNLKLTRAIAIIMVLLFLISLTGCSVLRSNPARKAQKQEEKENKKLKKAYQADVKAHYKMQTRETRNRMNKNLNKVSKDFKRKKGKSKWKCS